MQDLFIYFCVRGCHKPCRGRYSSLPPHSKYAGIHPIVPDPAKKKKGGRNVLHSRQDLKYATSIALSLETMAASLTNVDGTKPRCSFYSRRSDLQPILLIFFFTNLFFFLSPPSRSSAERLPAFCPVSSRSLLLCKPELSGSCITHPRPPYPTHPLSEPPPRPTLRHPAPSSGLSSSFSFPEFQPCSLVSARQSKPTLLNRRPAAPEPVNPDWRNERK